MNRFANVAVAALVCLCWSAEVSAEESTTIAPKEKWCNLFSGSEVTLHFAVRSAIAQEGRLNWSLSVNRRTVEHGRTPLAIAAGRVADIALPLKIPEVKQGVILEAQLGVAVYAMGADKPLAENSKTVWIFPRDPFVDRSDWLNRLKITLFDPEGKTADVFDKANVPFKFTKNISALDELRDGILLIAEGTAWKDYRGLGEEMVKAAARGVPVLCLAPGDGSLTLPGSEGAGMPRPVSLTLRPERHYYGTRQAAGCRRMAARRTDCRPPPGDQERPRSSRGRSVRERRRLALAGSALRRAERPTDRLRLPHHPRLGNHAHAAIFTLAIIRATCRQIATIPFSQR